MHQKWEKEPVNFSWWDLTRAIWFFMEGRRKKYFIWMVVLFSMYFYQLVPAIIVARVINIFAAYKPGQPLMEFYVLAAVFGILAGAVAFIRLTGKNVLGDLQSEARYRARTLGFERLVDFSILWHDKENTGNKVQRIHSGDSALGQIQNIVHDEFFTIVTSFVGVFAAYLFLNWRFAVFMVVYLTGFFAIQRYFHRRLVVLQDEANRMNEQASGTFYEGVNNVMTIKTLGAQKTFKTNVIDREMRTLELAKRRRRLGITKWKVFQLFNALSVTVNLLLVGNGFVTGAISIGAIYIYGSYLNKLTEAAGASTFVFDQLVEYRSAIGRMMPIFWKNETSNRGTKKFPANWKTISIKDLVFNYNKDFMLKLSEMTVQRNSQIGIVGHSGSGKSTLAKLLMGLYTPLSGSFTVDSVPYLDISHEEITNNLSIVLQDSEMFNLSMKDNITLMRRVKPDLFEKAVEISQLSELIERLPEGLDTLIGEKGYRLSGGERQRVGIARAICKNSPLIVFDEATSSLDSKTEQLIQNGIENELEDKTLIIIAHRLSTLKKVDQIYVFDHGVIVESGPYSQLSANPASLFAKLQKIQATAEHKQT